MYSDRSGVLEDPVDLVHTSLSQGNKVIYYQKECYRRTFSCPASASSSVTNLDSCGKLEGSAASVPASSSSRTHSSNSVDSGTKHSLALVSDDWEQEENEVFEDVTMPSPGAKMFVAALSDVVQQDVASGKYQYSETETTKPGPKALWLPTSSCEGSPQDHVTVASENETTPQAYRSNVNSPGNKTQWLDTGSPKPPRNKSQWQDRLESNDNKAQRSDRSKVNKGQQWEGDTKYHSEMWLPANPDQSGKKAAQWRDTDKTKGKNELDTVTAKPKKQCSNKQDTLPSQSSSESCSEPILMKLPKGKLVMTKLSVLEKLSLPYIEEGRVKVLSNVREPDDQHCYLFIPDVKNYPEVLESLIENWWSASTGKSSEVKGMYQGVAGEVEKRITYSRNQLIIIKLFGNGCNSVVPGIPESLCRRIRKNKN